MSGSRADGANPLGGGLHGHRWTFVETVLFASAGEKASSQVVFKSTVGGNAVCVQLCIHLHVFYRRVNAFV